MNNDFSKFFSGVVSATCFNCGEEKRSSCTDDLDQELVLEGWHEYDDKLFCQECFVAVAHRPKKEWLLTCERCRKVFESSAETEKEAIQDFLRKSLCVENDGTLLCNNCHDER